MPGRQTSLQGGDGVRYVAPGGRRGAGAAAAAQRKGAVRLFAAAFATEPKLADDERVALRYAASCQAALAAAGKGRDSAALARSQRLGLRRQALTWLRAELSLRAKQLRNSNPAERAAVQEFLRRWQSDPDLAGLRDRDALAGLSAEERQACRKLWADVEALVH
jgi:hypothetical protein